MSVSADYYTFPTNQIVNIVKTSDNIVDDIINILEIGYNLTESEEDNEKFQFSKNLLYTRIPEFFNKNRIDINGLSLIAKEIENHYSSLGESFFSPLSSKEKGYYNYEYTHYGDELLLFQAIVYNYYNSSEFPFDINGILIENTSGYEKILRNSEFNDKLFDDSIIDFAENLNRGNLNIDKFTIPRILNVFQLAIERKEDIIFGIQ
jgi:hypothetical protein